MQTCHANLHDTPLGAQHVLTMPGSSGAGRGRGVSQNRPAGPGRTRAEKSEGRKPKPVRIAHGPKADYTKATGRRGLTRVHRSHRPTRRAAHGTASIPVISAEPASTCDPAPAPTVRHQPTKQGPKLDDRFLSPSPVFGRARLLLPIDRGQGFLLTQ